MTRIHVLGAGTPTPTPTRFGSSFVLQTGDDRLMIDCGPAATAKLVQAGLWPTEIDYLFFTHHHFDHDVDYPCFLLCRWDQSIGKENRLQVFGPTLTEQLTHRILDERDGAFSHDWIARVNHPLSQQVYVNRGGVLPRRPPDVLAKDVGPGRIFSGPDWEVTAAPAEHVQPYLDSLAYRIDTPDGSVVFTGDTQPLRLGPRTRQRRRRDALHVLGRPGAHGRGGRVRRPVRHHRRGRTGPGRWRQDARPRAHRPAPVEAPQHGKRNRRRQAHL